MAYADSLVAAVADRRPDLVGVYLHGSAALGGFHPTRSDYDVLVVVASPAEAPSQRALGEAIAAVPGCPGTGLELSVITAATAADVGDGPFEVHVNTTSTPYAVVLGAGRSGDPDLILHCAVCREHAVALYGPPAVEVIGAVPRERILAAAVAELDWAAAHASPEYAVLNACRALRYAQEGTLSSKVDGGEWYLARHREDPAVRAAVDAILDGTYRSAAMRSSSGTPHRPR